MGCPTESIGTSHHETVAAISTSVPACRQPCRVGYACVMVDGGTICPCLGVPEDSTDHRGMLL